MKESRKEFIKELYDGSCDGLKKRFEKEFPKLFKKEVLTEARKRYKNLMVSGKHGIKATDKEVEEALIKEAKRRGFKRGVKFIKLSNGVVQTVYGLPYFQAGRVAVESPITEWSSLYKGGCSNPSIFDNGKWATIVETITKEQAEKELGKTILN